MSSVSHSIPRRAALRQTFFFSAALALGLRSPRASAREALPDARNFLMIGDWAKAGDRTAQKSVAAGMQAYLQGLRATPDGLFLVGDNFYGKFPGGVECPRWQTDFEEMYPASTFPGPCWAMLGNHDYNEELGVKLPAQLAYAAAHPGTRWTMPAKWYRFEWPVADPLVSFLVLDSNWLNTVLSLTPEEREAQRVWLEAELARPRTAPWLVAMAHHPLYSNGTHGDHPHLIAEWGPLFQKHGVDFYFCGHDHDLQHLEFDGLRTSFVVSGGGGAGLREMRKTRGPFGRSIHGFTHLEVSREKFIVRHLDPQQNQLHAFSRTPAGQIEILS